MSSNRLIGAATALVAALYASSPFTYGKIPQELVVLGSSVAAGAGADTRDEAWAYRLEKLLENQSPDSPIRWKVENASVGGDNTQRVLKRFEKDVATAHKEANMVIIALSLANEGLPGSGAPDAVYDSFRNGLAEIITRCRSAGFYPIISLVYPNGGYTPAEYALVKKMNLLLNTWDLPSINMLGSIDDGNGHWVAGNFHDPGHPNSLGHDEMFHAVVPSLFDAIASGKTKPPQWKDTPGCLRLQRDAGETSPLQFVPGQPMGSFTLSFRIRSNEAGTIATVGTGNERATLELRDGALVYIGPTGAETSVPVAVEDGSWHDIAWSHRHAAGETLLYVDGLPKGTVKDSYVPDRIVIGGNAGATGRMPAPLQADYQDVAIYRAAWTPEEALAQIHGALQQASLEICCPLADESPAKGTPVENRAQSLATLVLQTGGFSRQLAANLSETSLSAAGSAPRQ